MGFCIKHKKKYWSKKKSRCIHHHSVSFLSLLLPLYRTQSLSMVFYVFYISFLLFESKKKIRKYINLFFLNFKGNTRYMMRFIFSRRKKYHCKFSFLCCDSEFVSVKKFIRSKTCAIKKSFCLLTFFFIIITSFWFCFIQLISFGDDTKSLFYWTECFLALFLMFFNLERFAGWSNECHKPLSPLHSKDCIWIVWKSRSNYLIELYIDFDTSVSIASTWNP